MLWAVQGAVPQWYDSLTVNDREGGMTKGHLALPIVVLAATACDWPEGGAIRRV